MKGSVLTIDNPSLVWLLCQLKAGQGEAWFDAASLRLIKE